SQPGPAVPSQTSIQVAPPQTGPAVLLGSPPWPGISVGGMQERNIRELSLVSGKTYYIWVAAKNGAGLWSKTGTSDGITVDTSPPSRPEIVSFSRATIQVPNSLTAVWKPSEDSESGIKEYYLKVGRTDGGDEVCTRVTAGTSVNLLNLPSLEVGVYYLSLQAMNKAGLISKPDTAALTILYEDDSPPSPPFVTAGYDTAASILTAQWGSWDNQSGIVEYQWSIIEQLKKPTKKGSPVKLIKPYWTSAGMEQELSETVTLLPGKVYFLKVKAINGVGLSSIGVSSPMELK
ncbi:MAG: hypothetical protein QME81_14705, partial [bacterium]|nr:hypothetical protein [bacterium]